MRIVMLAAPRVQSFASHESATACLWNRCKHSAWGKRCFFDPL